MRKKKEKSHYNYDYSKLKGKIVEKFQTQHLFAEKIGMGRVSLSQRMHGKLNFTQTEINMAIEVLGLTVDDIPEYFFRRIEYTNDIQEH